MTTAMVPNTVVAFQAFSPQTLFDYELQAAVNWEEAGREFPAGTQQASGSVIWGREGCPFSVWDWLYPEPVPRIKFSHSLRKKSRTSPRT